MPWDKLIDNVPSELRTQIEIDLMLDYQPLAVYRKHDLDQYMAVRTFQTWAREIRDENLRQIIRDRQAVLSGVLEDVGDSTDGLSETQRLMKATLLVNASAAHKATTQINAVKGLLDMQADRRKQEQHQLKCKLAELKISLQEKSETDDKGRAVVSMEEVAKLLHAIDMDED